jgi:hypothetical protein
MLSGFFMIFDATFKIHKQEIVVSSDIILFFYLKVPKSEIFVTELFILSDPIWVGDLRTEPKKPFV